MLVISIIGLVTALILWQCSTDDVISLANSQSTYFVASRFLHEKSSVNFPGSQEGGP